MAMFKRSKIPALVRDQVALRRGERLLAGTSLPDGGWVAVTSLALHLAGPGGEIARNPWGAVNRAMWDEETSTLTVLWVDGSTPTDIVFDDADRSAVPEALRDRVQSSVVSTEFVEAGPGVIVRAVVRRDEDGSLYSEVLVDGPLSLDDPVIRRRVEEAESRVRSNVGLVD